jgi:hypothetical protein
LAGLHLNFLFLAVYVEIYLLSHLVSFPFLSLILKLSQAFGQPPGLWIRMQVAYDLWQAEQQPRQKVAPLNVAVL